MAANVARGALIAIPLALVAVAVVQRRRNGGHMEAKLPMSPKAQEKISGTKPLGKLGGAKMQGMMSGAKLQGMMGGTKLQGSRLQGMMGGAKPQGKRHKPNNRMRYYGLTLLINALERDRTRKAVIAGLKLAQKRA
ncbi:MAG: hypothetical protein JWO42_922 [Chloroflexi bacterium]|jgi:hypothetical protein|nr:hypothetical protein [Chloroflexota bacterium]